MVDLFFMRWKLETETIRYYHTIHMAQSGIIPAINGFTFFAADLFGIKIWA